MLQLVIVPILLLLLYAVVIRPQQQRVREQQAVVSSLVVGEEVMSTAGMIGRITALTDDLVTLEIAAGVEVRMARMAIARRMPPDPAQDDATRRSVSQPADTQPSADSVGEED